MALVLSHTPPTQNLARSSISLPELTRHPLRDSARQWNGRQSWTSLQRKLKSQGRFSCLFSDNRREEEARRALEGALGGKKSEFEKWNKEIKRREASRGGGDAGGGGGWFGWGRRFGWSNDDNFWQEVQQTILAVLGIVVMYLIVAKGDVMLAVVFNPLLYALRSTRNGFTFIMNRVSGKTLQDSFSNSETKSKQAYSQVSAKDRVSKKWGSE